MNKKKQNIPKALREQVWIKEFGDNTFKAKCPINWCNNYITPFDYHVGHNNAESKGGKTTLDNLIPICSRCNLSMSNNYSIDDWKDVNNIIKNENIEYNSKRKHTVWLCCFPIKF